MAIAQSLLPEFDMEMGHTRKTLERVPDGKFDWKPHPKSGSIGWLASHLATIPSIANMVLKGTEFDLASARQLPQFRSVQEIVATFDQNVAGARAAIAAASDADLMVTWKLLKGGQTMLALPRLSVLRTIVFSHIIHHRAQMGVYLRLNDIPVPSIYGPSADEGGF